MAGTSCGRDDTHSHAPPMTDAEQGNLQAQADLFCDMEERDGHIFSEITKRKQAVNGLPWGQLPSHLVIFIYHRLA